MKAHPGLVQKISTLAFVLGLGGAALAIGCSGDYGAEEQTGELGVELQVASGVTINTIRYTITKGNGTIVRQGTVDVHGTQGTATFSVRSLAQGIYRIAVTGTGSNGRTYSANALFAIGAGETTNVFLQAGLGRLSVTATRCATIKTVTVTPTAVVGSKINVAVSATGLNLHYAWSASSGSFDSPTSATTKYLCTSVGSKTLTISVNNGSCSVAKSVVVTCTSSGGGSGGASSGGASSGGASSGGASSGGASSGGASSGGASSGGASSGGASSGGASSGGASSGGASSGGASSGGASSGGASSGGASSGGASSGGASSGGASSGGEAPVACLPAGSVGCGDGLVNSGETCDPCPGPLNSPTAACQLSGAARQCHLAGAGYPATVDNTFGAQVCTFAYEVDDCGDAGTQITSDQCLSCENVVADGTADCTFAPGTADGGPAAGSARKMLCNQAVECMRQTNCAKENNLDCYCGTVGASCFSPDPANPTETLANGPCKAAIEAGLESIDATDIQVRFGNPLYGGGLALLRLATDHDSCKTDCFR